MNTVNTEFSSVEVWFTDQVSKVLEIEDNVNLTLIMAKNQSILQQKLEQMLQKLPQKEQFKNCRSNRRFDWKKIADKITSVGKSKEKEKAKKAEKIYIPPE